MEQIKGFSYKLVTKNMKREEKMQHYVKSNMCHSIRKHIQRKEKNNCKKLI